MINNNTSSLNLKYFVEYTNEPDRKEDYSNIKQSPNITDLETAISRMFLLRKQNKHNIAIGYEITDNNTNKLIIEDNAWNLEDLRATTKEDKLQQEVNKQYNMITELRKEIELFKQFLNKYNAYDRFTEEMKDQLIKLAI